MRMSIYKAWSYRFPRSIYFFCTAWDCQRSCGSHRFYPVIFNKNIAILKNFITFHRDDSGIFDKRGSLRDSSFILQIYFILIGDKTFVLIFLLVLFSFIFFFFFDPFFLIFLLQFFFSFFCDGYTVIIYPGPLKIINEMT